MSQNDTATVIQINEGTKTLLAAMNFPPVPAEANFIAFYADGSNQYIRSLDLDCSPEIRSDMICVIYHTGVTLEY